jgi:hypothetical protein
MNQRDQQNVKFLLGLSPIALEAWFSQASIDDRDYAMEILEAYEGLLDQELAEAFFGYDMPTGTMQ